MYNENKANLLKDVLSPAVVTIAVAVHIAIVVLFCAMGNSQEKPAEETKNESSAVAGQVSPENDANQVSESAQDAKKNEKEEAVPVKKNTSPDTAKAATEKTAAAKEQSAEKSGKKQDAAPAKSEAKTIAPKNPATAKKPAQSKAQEPAAKTEKKRVKNSSDIKRGQFKKGNLKKK